MREIVRFDSRVLRDLADALISFGPDPGLHLPLIETARGLRYVVSRSVAKADEAE